MTTRLTDDEIAAIKNRPDGTKLIVFVGDKRIDMVDALLAEVAAIKAELAEAISRLEDAPYATHHDGHWTACLDCGEPICMTCIDCIRERAT